jgi:hypothetical protein
MMIFFRLIIIVIFVSCNLNNPACQSIGGGWLNYTNIETNNNTLSDSTYGLRQSIPSGLRKLVVLTWITDSARKIIFTGKMERLCNGMMALGINRMTKS